MANRNFQNNSYHLERKLVSLFANVSIGATGSPTLNYGMGITSIERTALGEYKLTLNDSYMRLLSFNVMIVNDTLAEHTVDKFGIKTETVSTNKEINFMAIGETEALVEVADGSTLLIEIKLKNSSVER